MSLGNRFAVALILLAVPIVVFALYQGWLYDRVLMEQTTERIAYNLEQTAKGLDSEVSRAKLTAATIAYDDGLALVNARRLIRDPVAILEADRVISAHYENLFTVMRPEVSRVGFYFKGDGSYFFSTTTVVDDEAAMRTAPWYRAALEGEEAVVADTLAPADMAGAGRYQLTVAIRPDPNLAGDIELVYLVMTPNFFNSVLRRFADDTGAAAKDTHVVTGSSGQVLFPVAAAGDAPVPEDGLAAVKGVPAAGPRLAEFGGRTMLVCRQELTTVPWRIASLSDWEALGAVSAQVRTWAWLFLAASAAAFMLFSLAGYRAIVRPLTILANRIDRYAQGEAMPASPTQVPPEFRHVFERFARMTGEIQSLHEARLKAELAALQFQINPHFLSNTLGSLRFMAMMSKADGIKSMVEQLIDMMEYQLAPAGNLSTVADEFENIRRYVAIMKVRFGDTFDVRLDIGEGLADHPVLRMLLQPAVENAIEHGLRGLKERGVVELTAFRAPGGRLGIDVRDNGRGIAPERLAHLLDPGQTDAGSARHRIGLVNVNQRIKAHYGPAFGIRIESRPDQGTVVHYDLPESGEEDGHGQHPDR